MKKFDLKKAILENKATFFSSLNEGMFSWFTQDKNKQIGADPENRITVYMFDNKGNKWKESHYEGYGVFGGKDYYELLDQMNGGTGDRKKGIDLEFNKPKNKEVLFPALVSNPDFDWNNHDFTQHPKHDPDQGMFVGDEEYGYDDSMYIDESRPGYKPEIGSTADKYYKDAEADDAEHIEALEKDMKDDKKSSKMKKSELKAKIKEMILAEMDLDVTDETSGYDFLAELEAILEAEEKEADAEEEIDVTDEFSAEEPQTKGGINVTQNADADLTGIEKETQDNLEAALEAAKKLGDEKLATQIGNTLTFFTKQHVVK